MGVACARGDSEEPDLGPKRLPRRGPHVQASYPSPLLPCWLASLRLPMTRASNGTCRTSGVTASPCTSVASDRPVPSTMSPELNNNTSFPRAAASATCLDHGLSVGADGGGWVCLTHCVGGSRHGGKMDGRGCGSIAYQVLAERHEVAVVGIERGLVVRVPVPGQPRVHVRHAQQRDFA